MKKTYLKALLFTFLFFAQTAHSACLSQLRAAALCPSRTTFVNESSAQCIRKFGSTKCNNSSITLPNGGVANMWTQRADENYNACIRLNMGMCVFNAKRLPSSNGGGQ